MKTKVKDVPYLKAIGQNNNLGDYKVVFRLLRDFASEILTHEGEELVELVDTKAKELAKIFLGEDDRYAGPEWYSPGQVDVYVGRKKGIDSNNADERVAGALVRFVLDLLQLSKQVEEQEALAEQWQWAVVETIKEYSLLMMGIPEVGFGSGKEAPFPPEEEKSPPNVKPSPFKGRGKSLPGYFTKDRGQPCKQGEAAEQTGCIPADKQPQIPPEEEAELRILEARKKPKGRRTVEEVQKTRPQMSSDRYKELVDQLDQAVATGDPEALDKVKDEAMPEAIEKYRYDLKKALLANLPRFRNDKEGKPIIPKADPGEINELKKHYKKWSDKVWGGSAEEAFTDYTGGGYSYITQDARKCPETLDCLDKKYKKYFDQIDKALAEAPELPEPIMVYRGINLEDTEAATEFVEKLKGNLNGIMTMPGPISTSLSFGVASDFGDVLFQISATKGAYIGANSDVGDEKEFMMRHNSQFKIVEITRTKKGKHLIRLEAI